MVLCRVSTEDEIPADDALVVCGGELQKLTNHVLGGIRGLASIPAITTWLAHCSHDATRRRGARLTESLTESLIFPKELKQKTGFWTTIAFSCASPMSSSSSSSIIIIIKQSFSVLPFPNTRNKDYSIATILRREQQCTKKSPT